MLRLEAIDRLAIYLPMIVGALLGWGVNYVASWQGVLGMTAGAFVWFAYETRKNTKATLAQIQQMQEHFEILRGDNLR